MKKIVFSIIISVLFIGCVEYPIERTIKNEKYICEDNTVDKRAIFNTECIKNANPKSDEEPEDWIELCENMATRTYCKKKAVILYQIKTCHWCYWENYKYEIMEE